MADSGGRTSRSLSLTTGGITVLGVVLSIGTTVGIGLSGPWYLRLGAGVAVTLLLVVVVKVGSNAGRGPLARLADWMIGSSSAEGDDGRGSRG